MVVDPGLYLKTKRDLMWMNTETQKRELPTAFKLFTGTPQLICGCTPRTFLPGNHGHVPGFHWHVASEIWIFS